jgi:hypothetical protein
MKESYIIICRLLAASGYKEKELVDFIEQATVAGPESFLSTIRELRRLEMNQSAFRVFADTPSDTSIPPPNDTALKIERLLIVDAHMPRAAAINALTEEVQRNFPSRYIPSGSHKGFGNWIRQLAKVVPEKDLLFFATAIRNRVVHDAPGDWRLK